MAVNTAALCGGGMMRRSAAAWLAIALECQRGTNHAWTVVTSAAQRPVHSAVQFTALRSAARGCNCAPSALHVERQSPGVPACQWDDCGRFVSDLAAFGVAVVLRVLDRGGQPGEQ